MTKKQAIQIFEDKNFWSSERRAKPQLELSRVATKVSKAKIRTVWDDEKEKWFFSIVDVCGVLTEQPDYDHAKNYWKVLKFRLINEGNESVTNCNQLKLVSPKDGKRYKTDVADLEQLFRIIQSIPSPKAEPMKRWMARTLNS